ncbi:hypothetical protein [Marinobacter vinifirmus]|uniref:hypothetical protein n=1 Tax=Marinobacter vinifirmus TaxID=355591 RepID=UPI0012B69C24|nr:hypothetical protein [Marinobacter vinifirmus]
MTWIDLGDPLPKCQPDLYEPVEWDLGEIRPLPAAMEVLDPTFGEILNSRMSQRRFGRVDKYQLGRFLWHACRTRGVGASELGFDLEHRASPSAGAIHPIHVGMRWPGDDRWWLYRPRTHELAEIRRASDELSGLYEHSQEVLRADDAIRILFLAEPGKTLGKYHDGCSLIWRDAGSLLAVMAFTATALGLNFCPLGITGEPWASNLGDQGKLVGVGLALIGSPPGA